MVCDSQDSVKQTKSTSLTRAINFGSSIFGAKERTFAISTVDKYNSYVGFPSDVGARVEVEFALVA